ncbi:SIR2 family protein [Burkholderia diffusa]|uniref:Uncharacterized protein n=1 Tax=Burkholderia diffusa TaxID=488732 RepID=A0A6P2K6H8_9BURK|nr:SIR2 family protein [Burkholderia diffusa]KAB0654229.1 hypothetical protein F7R23_18500 [Burkholderia diffusa]MBM2653968.1 SIR2 family protein [Burkholderia diffusa]VWB52768.1 hypothetical protein BDI24065_02425 [Burkholderia diffusa]
MEWDKSFVDELAARRCIVFMGSGVSAGCRSADGTKSPPDWAALLRLLHGAMPLGSDKDFALAKIEAKEYLDAAEVICSRVSAADFAAIMRAEFVAPRYQASGAHRSILKMDPKIVVTTNYDDIYERYCATGDAAAGYNVCRYYETHLINDLRSPVRSIIKAHGCVTDPSKGVLTKHQYFKARQQSPNFFKILDALFITHTLLFIGYSLSDPDIQLLLENTNITAPSAHQHYAVVRQGSMHEALKSAATKSYNLRFVEYGGDGHEELLAGLEDLANLVVEKREANPTAI